MLIWKINLIRIDTMLIYSILSQHKIVTTLLHTAFVTIL